MNCSIAFLGFLHCRVIIGLLVVCLLVLLRHVDPQFQLNFIHSISLQQQRATTPTSSPLKSDTASQQRQLSPQLLFSNIHLPRHENSDFIHSLRLPQPTSTQTSTISKTQKVHMSVDI